MSNTEERIRKIIVEQLGVSAEEVTPDASFIDDLGADSLDTVELVMALEEEFDIEIPDEEAEKIVENKVCEFYRKLNLINEVRTADCDMLAASPASI